MPIEDKREAFTRYLTAVENGDTKKQAILYSGLQWSTLQRWLADDNHTITNERGEEETFASRLARARVHQAQAYADRGQEELEAATTEDWQVRKARAQYFQWRAAMANPKEYGDRKQVEVSGNVAHLHLDALRNRNTVNNLNVPIVSVKLLDTASLDDTDASAQHEADTP